MSIIESLKYNIAHRFEFINSYSSNRLKEYISSGQIKPYIQWDDVRKRVIFPQADLSDKSIILNEKFLEYLWMLIYSSWVIFEEEHMKREINETKGGNEIINRDIIKRAEDVRVFCRSFDFIKNDWPTELPNPQKPIELDKFYTERVNGIFIDSVTLFLYHEFAHIILGHTSTSEIDWVTSISQEKEADEYAFEMYLNERSSKLEKYSAGLSALFTFFSPFFVLVFPRHLQQDTHPDIDLRFQNALERIGCIGNEERYSLYKLAVTLINDYLRSHEKALHQHGLETPHRHVETVQDHYEDYVVVLEHAKMKGI